MTDQISQELLLQASQGRVIGDVENRYQVSHFLNIIDERVTEGMLGWLIPNSRLIHLEALSHPLHHLTHTGIDVTHSPLKSLFRAPFNVLDNGLHALITEFGA